MHRQDPPPPSRPEANDAEKEAGIPLPSGPVREIPARPVDPTRYGDWEKNGRCIDF